MLCINLLAKMQLASCYFNEYGIKLSASMKDTNAYCSNISN